MSLVAALHNDPVEREFSVIAIVNSLHSWLTVWESSLAENGRVEDKSLAGEIVEHKLNIICLVANGYVFRIAQSDRNIIESFQPIIFYFVDNRSRICSRNNWDQDEQSNEFVLHCSKIQLLI